MATPPLSSMQKWRLDAELTDLLDITMTRCFRLQSACSLPVSPLSSMQKWRLDAELTDLLSQKILSNPDP
jgi:hypothetical protein